MQKRKPKIEYLEKADLIPPLMRQKMKMRDSLQKIREREKLLKADLNNLKDTLKTEDQPTDVELNSSLPKRPSKDTQQTKPVKSEMLTPPKPKDSTQKRDTAAS